MMEKIIKPNGRRKDNPETGKMKTKIAASKKKPLKNPAIDPSGEETEGQQKGGTDTPRIDFRIYLVDAKSLVAKLSLSL